jgi:tetratricopeptide (TPR) repeat protein
MNIHKYRLALISCFISLLFFSEKAVAQIPSPLDTLTAAEVDAAKAITYYQHGLKLMRQSNFKGAMESFGDAVDLDSSKTVYLYQLGLANFYGKNYKQTIEVMKALIKKDAYTDRYYQMMGQSYVELREPNKAYSVYLDGIKKMPKSGSLNCELGRIEYDHNNFNLAIQYWENGILCEPNYPSNYYYATKAYSRTSEKIWSVIYGEIFINLEISSQRTYEISRVIYEVYRQSIYIKSDKYKYVFFSDVPNRFSPKMMKDTLLSRKNFEHAYTITSRKCLTEFKTEFNLPELIKFRHKFVTKWYDKNYPVDYPNALFEYHRTLLSADFYDCYNYWLLSKGDVMEFNLWYERNQKKYDQFVKWLTDHPLEITKNNVVNRLVVSGE